MFSHTKQGPFSTCLPHGTTSETDSDLSRVCDATGLGRDKLVRRQALTYYCSCTSDKRLLQTPASPHSSTENSPQKARTRRQRKITSRRFATHGVASAGGKALPLPRQSIAGGAILVGDKVRDSQSLRLKVERVFLAQRRHSRLGKRVSGGPGRLVRCSGAVIVNAVAGGEGAPRRWFVRCEQRSAHQGMERHRGGR